MKKVLSIVLCAAMLLCFVPCVSLAAEIPGGTNIETGEYFILADGTDFVIETNETVTISGAAFLPDGYTLTVNEGGKLIVTGSLYVQGSLKVEGSLSGASKINVDENTGSAEVKYIVRDPAEFNWGPDGERANISVSYFSSPVDNLYGDAITERDWETLDFSAGSASFSCRLNEFLYIKATIKEDNPAKDKFDDARLKVYFNEIDVPYLQGVHRTSIQNAAEITFSYLTNESDYYSTKKITLPTGEGYEVIGRDCEANAEGAVELRYGQPFSFRVEIDEAYDMSNYEVYIYNGYGWTNLDLTVMLSEMQPAQPDQYGYYNIPSVEGDYTVQVVGVTKNETITLIGNIIDALRNVFNMIKEFLESLMELFSGNA